MTKTVRGHRKKNVQKPLPEKGLHKVHGDADILPACGGGPARLPAVAAAAQVRAADALVQVRQT
jgi:hypothetical protein